MRIQVLGPGCSKCKELIKRTERAVEELGMDVAVEKVSDLGEIMKHGIMMTPALVIDGSVKIVGNVPSMDELQSIIEKERGQAADGKTA